MKRSFVTRENVKLAAVALVCVTLSTVGPAVARKATDAKNADKVDGKHAVGSGAPVAKRKGKLVATSKRTGRLPDNIITKAPDSQMLDGVDSKAYRFISLDVYGTYVDFSATHVAGFGPNGGIALPDAGTPVFASSITIPPDFTGSSLKLHVLWTIGETGCSVELAPYFVGVGHVGEVHSIGLGPSTGMTGPGAVLAPAVSTQIKETVYTLSSPTPTTTQLRPGDDYRFGLFRPGADTCTADVMVHSLSVTY